MKLKMAEICHFENRQIAISQRKNHPISMQCGIQMQISNSMTVTWPIWKFLKFKIVDDHHLKIVVRP